ncbi:MAG: FAD-dependent oxidoreductase, partial [Opitutaceae bacterium]|nr:FAD-dependent oxidoreductase [Opitutaceae bacterium]
MLTLRHEVDLCVVGGGLAGLCAAIAAARHGANVVLMHDRPVLGGNASGEIRVPVMGAFGSWHRSVRETGIIEEIMLEALHGNPTGNWQMWDLALHTLALREKKLTLLLNCSCNTVTADAATPSRNGRIHSLRGWQTTTQTWHEVSAKLFADCSGDSILSSFCGAAMMEGREARSDFNESLALETASPTKLGLSLMFNWRETAAGSPPPRFVPPSWIHFYPSEESAPFHSDKISLSPVHGMNAFYVELGGRGDTIHDTERLRDELLKMGLGLIDHYKNRGDHGAGQLALDWFGFLPGKRESLRYAGDHVLTQNDIQNGTDFTDIVAYGGWPLDDHDSDGSLRKGKPTHTWHPVKCPYGIPLRCLYSKNVDNLFMAGRNISATHLAFCSTRVMATCAVMGQAVGGAAALATARGCLPREVGENHITALQRLLQEDDCWLPGRLREIPALTRTAALAASTGDPAPLRDGHDRPDEDAQDNHAWRAAPGQWAEYRFPRPRKISSARLVLDSDLKRKWSNMPNWYPRDGWDLRPPAGLVRDFSILTEDDAGNWRMLAEVRDNYQRLVRVPLDTQTTALRLVVGAAWGETGTCNIFSWDVRCPAGGGGGGGGGWGGG